MESVGARSRARAEAPPSSPPPLSPEPEVLDRSRPKRKLKASEIQDKGKSRRKRSTGRSLPCQQTNDASSSAAVSGSSARAQSVEPETIAHTQRPIASSATPSGSHAHSNGHIGTEQSAIETGSESNPRPHTHATVMNDILPSNSNSETIVVNREVLSELIGVEFDKRMNILGGNLSQSRGSSGQGDNLPTNKDQSYPLNNPTGSTHIGQSTTTVGSADQDIFRQNVDVANAQTCHQSQALEQAVSSLLSDPGEKNKSLINTMKFDLPLASALYDKTKQQIITRQYIELGNSLSPDSENDVNFNVTMGDDGPALVLNSSRKAKPILNINGWISAMHIYGSVYLRAHPDEVSPFFQYMEFVIKMARKLGFFWKQYDEAFRRAREHENIPWGTVLVNQYVSCFAAAMLGSNGRQGGKDSRSDNSFRKTTRSGDTFVPKPYCFALHREGFCKKSNCNWDHSCFACKGNHSILHCKKSNGSTQNKSK